jgi:hypothetical protein
MKTSLRLLLCTLAAVCLMTSATAAPATNAAPVKPSKEELRKEFEAIKARAETGDPRAQFSLANCYAKGAGVETNNTEALSWLILAVDKIPMASINRADLEKKLTPEEIRAGRMRARELRATIEAVKKAATK